jgi:hypothetical protein
MSTNYLFVKIFREILQTERILWGLSSDFASAGLPRYYSSMNDYDGERGWNGIAEIGEICCGKETFRILSEEGANRGAILESGLHLVSV